MKMRVISALLLGFLPVQSVFALESTAPDLSKMPAADVIKLGIAGPERIKDRCYNAKIDFCEKGSNPNNCTDNEVLERQTNVYLEKLKFELVKQKPSEKVPGVFVYHAVPKSFFKTENSLYKVRKTGKNSPLRLFVSLHETSCSMPKTKLDDSSSNQPKPTEEKSATKEVIKKAPTPSAVMDKRTEAALQFLTNIPSK